jgi:integrase
MAYRKKTRYPGVYERPGKNKHHADDICYDISYKRDGKKVWEKAGWASEGYSAKLAEQIRAERIRSMRHGLELPQDKPKTLFKDAVKKYLEWAKTNKAKEGRDDRYLYDKHLKKRFGNTRMDQISSFDLEKMKSELLKEEYAPATVKHALVLVRQIFNKAIVWNLYQGESPVKKVKMPTISNQRTRFLSVEEADALLKALKAKSQQVHDMALLSLHSGMRFGEIAGLKVHDVDLANGLINISDPKNRRPRRAYMTAAVKAMFQARIPKEAKSNDLVFPDEKGKKMEFVSKTFPRVVDALGLNKGVKDPRQKITFHSLRHTFASWLALQGEQIQTISELLGHRTLQMTMRYSHLTPDHRKAAIGRLEHSIVNGKKSESNEGAGE